MNDVIRPESPVAGDIAARLRWARDRAGYATATDAARAFGWQPPTYLAHENGTRGINRSRAVSYARAFHVSLPWLLTGQGTPLGMEREPVPIMVTGAVQAGCWQEAAEWSIDDQYPIYPPDDGRYGGVRRIGLEVRGESMNRVYPPGTVLICVSLFDMEIEPVGRRVIVRMRNRHGLVEQTCKELIRDEDGALWLWPRSTSPEHQTPIRVVGDEDEGLHIAAVVVGSYRPE